MESIVREKATNLGVIMFTIQKSGTVWKPAQK